MLSLASIANATRGAAFLSEGAELHELADTDLFKIFLNEDEMSKSSPDSSQSGPVSSPDSEFDSPPSTPSSPFAYGNKVDDEKINLSPAVFWNATIKEEPRDSDLSSLELDLDSDVVLKKEPFALSRDDLLKLSSKSLETYAQTLAASRPLTEDEERQLKRQRRLIKNRESAQLSRQRKRLYIEELEQKVSGLNTDNNDLMKQVAFLTSENQTLKEEMFHLQNFIKQSPVLMPTSGGVQVGKKTVLAAAIPTTTTSSLVLPNGQVFLSTISVPNVKLEKAEVRKMEDHEEQRIQMNEGSLVDKTFENLLKGESETIQYLLSHPEELKKILSQNVQGKKRKKGDFDEEQTQLSCQILETRAHLIAKGEHAVSV